MLCEYFVCLKQFQPVECYFLTVSPAEEACDAMKSRERFAIRLCRTIFTLFIQHCGTKRALNVENVNTALPRQHACKEY